MCSRVTCDRCKKATWSGCGQHIDEIMPTKKSSHILEDQEQLDAVIKRMKRAQGQVAAVVRMLEEGRSCEDVVHQMAAVGKAVNTAAFTLISSSLKTLCEHPCSHVLPTLTPSTDRLVSHGSCIQTQHTFV